MRTWLFVASACLLACDVSASISISNAPRDAAPIAEEATVTEAAAPPPAVRKLASRRVLIVGDSEACTVAPYVDETIAQFNVTHNQPYDQVGVDCKGGTVVQYWGAGGHMKQALVRHPNPDVVVVFLGTNHFWQKEAPPTETVTDLLGNATCVWVGNTAVKGHRWDINNLIRDRVLNRCSYFDTEAAGIALYDEVHPTRAGAVKWLQLVWETIPPKYEAANGREEAGTDR